MTRCIQHFGRKNALLYSHYPEEPLAKEKWVYFVRSADADELSFSSYDELKNRRIGVLRGASVTEEFWNFVKQHKNAEEAATDEINFRKLDRGRIDYVVTSYSNGVHFAKRRGQDSEPTVNCSNSKPPQARYALG